MMGIYSKGLSLTRYLRYERYDYYALHWMKQTNKMEIHYNIHMSCSLLTVSTNVSLKSKDLCFETVSLLHGWNEMWNHSLWHATKRFKHYYFTFVYSYAIKCGIFITFQYTVLNCTVLTHVTKDRKLSSFMRHCIYHQKMCFAKIKHHVCFQGNNIFCLNRVFAMETFSNRRLYNFPLLHSSKYELSARIELMASGLWFS